MAQDDELPPPSSSPRGNGQSKDQLPPDARDFQGFKSKKKVDWNNFIIEPLVYFSMNQQAIDLGFSPYVGYKVFEPEKSKQNKSNAGLFVGGGLTYFYTGYRNVGFTDGINTYYANAKWHTYGGGVFTQYNIWRGFFARARFEVLHRKLDDIYGNVDVRLLPNNQYKVIIPKVEKTIPALLIGGGYNLLRSKNFFMPIMISYNVLHNVTDTRYSIYRNTKGLVIQLAFVTIF